MNTWPSIAAPPRAAIEAISEKAPRSSGRDRAGWTLPLLLGLLFTIASAALVVIELAEPPPQPGFRGIALSNAVASRGARAGLALFRQHLTWLPHPASGVVLSPAAYIWGMRAAIVAMGLLQGLALLAVVRRPGGPWRWLIGPALASIVLLAYPPICTDVFSYASFGWESNLGFNPYLLAPAKFKGDPYAPMNDWTSITTPYGPIWTGISRAITAVCANNPFAVVIGFKLVAGLAAIGLGALAYCGARRLTSSPGHAVGALVIVAWSPILLIESAGTAHNDAPMMLLAVAGLLLVTARERGAVRAGLVLLALTVLIKPAALPLLGLAALVRLARGGGGLSARLRDWALDLAAIAALLIVTFAPYWSGGRLPRTLWNLQIKLYFDKALHANPLWVWAVPQVAKRIGGEAAAASAKAHAVSSARVVVIVFVLTAIAVAVWPVRRDERSGHDAPPSWLLWRQAWAWTAAAVGFGLIPINMQAWYAIWPLAPIALVWAMTAKTRRGLWIVPVLSLMLVGFLVYHTWPFSNHPTASSIEAHLISLSPTHK